MDDFSPLKFVNNSTPIRAIQPIMRDEERNRKKKEQEEQRRAKEEDVFDLQASESAEAKFAPLSQSDDKVKSELPERVSGEHIDVRI